MSVLTSVAKLKALFKIPGNLKAKFFQDLIDTIVDKTILGLSTTDDPTFGDITSTSITLDTVSLLEKSADPGDPVGGKAVLWMSDGTGAGDAGDIMMKISSPAGSGAVTKTVTLVDFSAA